MFARLMFSAATMLRSSSHIIPPYVQLRLGNVPQAVTTIDYTTIPLASANHSDAAPNDQQYTLTFTSSLITLQYTHTISFYRLFTILESQHIMLSFIERTQCRSPLSTALRSLLRHPASLAWLSSPFPSVDFTPSDLNIRTAPVNHQCNS